MRPYRWGRMQALLICSGCHPLRPLLQPSGGARARHGGGRRRPILPAAPGPARRKSQLSDGCSPRQRQGRALCSSGAGAAKPCAAGGRPAAAAAAATAAATAAGALGAAAGHHQPARPAAEPAGAYRQEGWCARPARCGLVRCRGAPLTWQCAAPRARRLGPVPPPPPPAAACRGLPPPAHALALPARPSTGRATYRPTSYSELVSDAVAAVAAAVNDGLSRLEVEFPAVSNVDGA